MVQQGASTIRVVVADDSAVMRRVIIEALRGDERVEVVAEAADGDEAIARCGETSPDVLTLDLSMPNTTGLDVLDHLRRAGSSVRVVVVSSFSPSLVERALDVLDAGATDLVAKPKIGDGFSRFAEQVRSAVAAAAKGHRSDGPAQPARIPVPRTMRSSAGDSRILVIASSTGGPRALGDVVPALGSSIGAGGVVVQHMPEGFTAPLARRLDASAQLSVREARTGDTLEPGSLLVAPAGHHLRYDHGTLRLDDSDPVGGLRPRADLTISDLARDAGARVVLLVLTGMGSDALDGARRVCEAGGIVIAQDESDCVVYGMPRNVIEHDLADAVGTLPEIPVLVERALATPVSS